MNKDSSAILQVPDLVRELYRIVGRLGELFPGQRFTPDGHLVGSIGEVLAAYEYGLDLLPNSTERHDAISCDGKHIQIKATQTKSIAISSEPEYLIVLKLHPDGTFNEAYNGPGSPVWQNSGSVQKNGQRRISFKKLAQLMADIPAVDRIKKNHTTSACTADCAQACVR